MVNLPTANFTAPLFSLLPLKPIGKFRDHPGGVGKSSVTANLAVALRNRDLNVGILDSDIFGPNIPKLMGLRGEPRISAHKKLIPLMNHGIQTMSMGYLVPEKAAVVWRGLMVQKALQQLLFDVEWRDLDVLLVDTPPGTGDVQITLGQQLKVDGAVIVTTSQDLALSDVRRGLTMFEKISIPILGIVENMSVFTCPKCHHEEHVFGESEELSSLQQQGVALLGRIPLSREMCGDVLPATDKHSQTGAVFEAIATEVLKKIS
ncbi:hypothetical protein KL949_001357 [Ogataea haglerorum]|nr:hypothetical protein KL913_001747 [Ogataea haglerorum]KAG7721625.1 hypothetical protein KL949_001357 [Ogataea haglerorum]KAG7739629.1 hypothetical protein KL923_002476 [Ogataea haglerorum]KAG7759585.1 hypothetical protein KL947_001966 [Ogataea haglerorum]KAG7769953.1 hypothetical protein KL931_002472 [Ogataea haglerorum]